VISRSLALAEASEKLVGGAGAPFSWREPPPMEYNAPPGTIQGLPHRYEHHYSGGTAQKRPENLRTPSGSHPQGNIGMQPYQPTTNQRVQGSSTPQRSAPRSYGQTDPHGIRLRPISDLRMLSSRRQSRVLMTLPQPMLIEVCLSSVSSTPYNPLASIP